MTLDSLRDPRLRVVESMRLVVTETKAGRCIAEAPEIEEAGLGATVTDAVYDLQRSRGGHDE